MRLLAINTGFSCKNVFAITKVSNSVMAIFPGFLRFCFRILNVLNCAMTKGLVVCNMLFVRYFYHKKLFCNVVQTSREISPPLRLLVETCV